MVLDLKYVLPEWLAATAVVARIECTRRRAGTSSGLNLNLWIARRVADKDVSTQSIFESARTGDIEHLRALCKSGLASPSDERMSGRTALHYAYAGRQQDACRFLLSQGANHFGRDNQNLTPCQFGVFSLLVENKISSIQALTLEKHLITEDEAFVSKELIALRKQLTDFAIFSARIKNESLFLTDNQILRQEFWTNSNICKDICHAAYVFRQRYESEVTKPWISFRAVFRYLCLISRCLKLIKATLDIWGLLAMVYSRRLLAVIRRSLTSTSEARDQSQPLFNRMIEFQSYSATSSLDIRRRPIILLRYILGIGSHLLNHSLYCEQVIAPGSTRLEWNCVS